MRVLVCGGRDYWNIGNVYRTLDAIHAETPISAVIQGEAGGADYLGKRWAIYRGIHHLDYPADWVAYPKAAGPIRNRQMLREGKPDKIVAFPGDKGTKNMIEQAMAAGVTVIQVADDGTLTTR